MVVVETPPEGAAGGIVSADEAPGAVSGRENQLNGLLFPSTQPQKLE